MGLDGSIRFTPGTLATPTDKALCGHVYLILQVSTAHVDSKPFNNWRADDVVVACNSSGEGPSIKIYLHPNLHTQRKCIYVIYHGIPTQSPMDAELIN